MIQARKLGHVVLRVRDAQKSKDFYMRALGLKLAWEDRVRGVVFPRTLLDIETGGVQSGA